MKFRLLLWLLGFMLERASKNNARFKGKLEGKDLILEIGCWGGAARYFVVQNQQLLSYPGKATAPVYLCPPQQPTLAITFDSAQTGFDTLTAKDKQLAFMSGIQAQRITIEGNPLFLMWLQSLIKLAIPGG